MGSPRKNGTSGPSSSRPPTVKFARRTSSGWVVSLTRDVDEIDFSGEFATGSGSGDFINYTVLMPPTPDNQPMGDGADNDTGTSSSERGQTGTGGVPPPPGYTGPGSEGGKGTGPTKTDRMSMMKSNQSMLIRSQTGDFDHNRWLFESKGTYGYGNAFWTQEGKEDQNGYPGMDMMGGARSACPTL